ncbi:hypothetical protein EDEG_01126 [Edhazardia aedis USNM 41457]|uniref:Uncharacterized protein n=1 Tax=Edhazardia aedis (strain USNM 41457) TaxID=1003232 RepID=J8ZYF2_EDHAE|nr:hypothetical protein EDEG_01126 [Edhazardia aedis USNM 41457]|eukprot:EJW04678.1 hypothetical protein EDEG_01126 [Edhazardia aedis USNM 41457]
MSFKDLLEVYLEDLNMKLLQEFVDIFVAKNSKFGYYGNLLLLNFVVYERWVKKHLDFDFTGFYSIFSEHFVENRVMNFEKLNEIYDQYESGKNSMCSRDTSVCTEITDYLSKD